MNRPSLTVYIFAHLCVDFACLYLLFGRFSGTLEGGQPMAIGFLLYNALAFGFQPLIGYFCDTRERVPAAPMGCILLLVGLLLPGSGYPAVGLCALGNAFFHVGGGMDCLGGSGGKMAPNGYFVSSGAIGVGLGALMGKAGFWPELPVILMVLCLVLTASVFRDQVRSQYRRPPCRFQTSSLSLAAGGVILLCCLSVVVRALGGNLTPMDWKADAIPLLLLLPSFAACAGKAAGGWIADRAGPRKTGMISLVAAIPCLCLGGNQPALCALGLVLLNMTMPITLCAIADKLPRYPGLAFGTAAMALLLGSLPAFFFAIPQPASLYLLPALSIASALSLFFALRKDAPPSGPVRKAPGKENENVT